MVTFALPVEDSATGDTPSTPKSRPPLSFSKRSYGATTLLGGSLSRPGASIWSSSRRLLNPRNEVPPSSLSRSAMSTSRNVFRTSNFTDAAGASPATPGVQRRVFAPGATPEPGRFKQSSMAPATPRAAASRVIDKDLFPMRISSPPQELTGEALTEQVPKDWNSKGSIYADQFLAHLCPPDLDEEQRRQFFCILDLRRLKYAANEIFTRKDWKLNIINFAKEFEKSRSIILLRYGLYEFQNVKPSREVLKRWRRDHGLPDPDDEEDENSPTKPTPSKKRKVDDDESTHQPKNATASVGAERPEKRRAMDKDVHNVARDHQAKKQDSTSATSRTKSSISAEEPQTPSTPTQAAPSSAKSLFEKITNNKSASTVKSTESSAPAPPARSFLAHKPTTSSGLARSVFTNPSVAQDSSASNNPFSHLSDASSAKHSGADGDAESESDTGTSDKNESAEATKSDAVERTSVFGSGTGFGNSAAVSAFGSGSQTESVAGSNTAAFGSAFGNAGKTPQSLFASASQPAASSFGSTVASSSVPQESPTGRSLFERVTKDNDGEPGRAEAKADASASQDTAGPVNQTWNPSTTPIKFAPAAPPAQKSSMFSNAPSFAPGSSLFGQKSTDATQKPFATSSFTAEKESSVKLDADSAAMEKDGSESDKENETRPNKKASLEPKAPASHPFGSPWAQSSLMSTAASKPSTSVFGSLAPKPSSSEESSAFAAPKKSDATTSLFGSMAPKPSTPEDSSAFGTPKKPDGTSSLFGSMTPKPSTSEESSSAFTAPKKPDGTTSSVFGSSFLQSKPAETAKETSVGDEASKATTAPAFGASSTGFSFAQGSTNSPFGATANAPFSGATTAPSMFGSKPATTTPFSSFSSTASTQPGSSFGSLSSPAKADEAKDQATPKASLFGASQVTLGGSPSTQKRTFETQSMSEPSDTQPNKMMRFNQMSSDSSTLANIEKFGEAAKTAVGSSAPSGTAGPFGSAPAANPGSSFNFSFQGPGGSTVTNPFASQSNLSFGQGSPASGAPMFGGAQTTSQSASVFGSAAGPGSSSLFTFAGSSTEDANAPPGGGLQAPRGSSTTGTNSPMNFGDGGSSLATTPATGTPEPSSQVEERVGADEEEGEKHDQINLTDGAEEDEDIVYHIRAKLLQFVSQDEKSEGAKSKSPWTTKGLGPLRLLKHKETGAVRLLLRAEPRGHVALNRALLPQTTYESKDRYVKIMTANEGGTGLETWMLQVKTKDMAKKLAEVLEKNKNFNKK